jgi:16S rRNA processing protein RimM
VILVVGRVARAHGIRGEVSVEIRTDDPDRRFAPGSELATDPDRGALVVCRARTHAGRLIVAFDGVTDRDAAEALRGTLLLADSATSGETEPDEWWDHELAGLEAVTPEGRRIGVVREVVHAGPQDLVAIDHGGREVLVPFVAGIVTEVDVAGGRIVVDPPPGLLDLGT